MKSIAAAIHFQGAEISHRAAEPDSNLLKTNDISRCAIELDTRSDRARPMALVVILAFAQSMLFLALLLMLCANAGAANQVSAEFKPEIQKSTYAPAKIRDPFLPDGTTGEAKPTPATSFAFELQGILYQRSDPAAIVNDQLMRLNKTITLEGKNGSIEVKAVEITRDRVVLEAGGQRTELRLNPIETGQ
jgi:hypothetical protein